MSLTRRTKGKAAQLRCNLCQLVFVGKHDCPFEGASPALVQKLLSMENQLRDQESRIESLENDMHSIRLNGRLDGEVP